jgi:hypothetical protein
MLFFRCGISAAFQSNDETKAAAKQLSRHSPYSIRHERPIARHGHSILPSAGATCVASVDLEDSDCWKIMMVR